MILVRRLVSRCTCMYYGYIIPDVGTSIFRAEYTVMSSSHTVTMIESILCILVIVSPLCY